MPKSLLATSFFLLAQFALAQEVIAGQPSPIATAAGIVTLSDAVPILLRTRDDLSSASSKVGDQVSFRVTEDVKVSGLIVVRRGAEALGQITAVQTKARKGRAGSLDVGIQSVRLLTGERAPLRAEQHSKGTGGAVGQNMASAAVASRGILLPLLPLFLLEKGGDARLPADTKITAYVNGDVQLDRKALELAQPVLAHATGPATVTIFRAKFPPATAYAPSVYCGNVALTRLEHGRYFKIQLPAGKYSFRSSDDQILELQLGEGQEVYLQMQLIVHGFNMKGHMTQLGNGEGLDELAGLREADTKNLTKISAENLGDLLAVPQKKK
jgi:hypothetical protein